MYVIFIRCDKRTSNNKHKKQSQNDVQYKAAKPKKNYKTIETISLDKAIQRTDKKSASVLTVAAVRLASWSEDRS